MAQCMACVHTEGRYDIQSLVPSHQTVTQKLKDHPDSISKKIWGEKTITWKLETDTPTIAGRDIETEIFKRIFTQIGIYIPNRIILLNKSTADADIRINFSKTDPSWKDHPGWMAFAFGPQTGIGGDITFNALNYIWTPDGAPIRADKAYDLGWIPGFQKPDQMIKTWKAPHTGLHEAEHAMGLNHIEEFQCPGAVLNPYYNGELLLKQCEINILQKFYGKTNLAPEQITEMQKRFTAPYETI